MENNTPIHEDNANANAEDITRKSCKTDQSKSSMSAQREIRVKKKNSLSFGITEGVCNDDIKSDIKKDKKKVATTRTDKSHEKRGDRSLYDIDERWIKNNVSYPRPTPLQVQYVRELLSLL